VEEGLGAWRRRRDRPQKQEKADDQAVPDVDAVPKEPEEPTKPPIEKKKKEPLRYPAEDVDFVLADKNKKAGAKVQRLVPSRIALPFGEHS